MDISPYLKLMVAKGASDLFFSAGARPNVRVAEPPGPAR